MLYAVLLYEGDRLASRFAVMSEQAPEALIHQFEHELAPDSALTVDVTLMEDLFRVHDPEENISEILSGPKTDLSVMYPDCVITPVFIKQRPILSPSVHPT